MKDAGEIEALVRKHTRLGPLALVPEIQIHQASEAVPLWEATEAGSGAQRPPPFWAFAWVGGQALARYLLDRPESVAGKRVLDMASGSGIVAIAARKAGAAHVTAADTDPFAAAAISINAAANEAALEIRTEDLLGGALQEIDVVLVGDFFYDRDLADRTTQWLSDLCKKGTCILIGDPGRTYLPKEHLTFVAAYDVPASREIEDRDIRRCTIYRWKG